MTRMKNALVSSIPLVLALATLPACGPDLEKAWFNAWFQNPDGGKVLLGQAEGITRCRSLATIKAQELNIENQNWDYVCCLRSNTSECAEEHK